MEVYSLTCLTCSWKEFFISQEAVQIVTTWAPSLLSSAAVAAIIQMLNGGKKMKTASSWQILDLTFRFRGLLLLAGTMWCMKGEVEGHSWAIRLAKGTRLWLMLVCSGDEPSTPHHEPSRKPMQWNVCVYTHTGSTHVGWHLCTYFISRSPEHLC